MNPFSRQKVQEVDPEVTRLQSAVTALVAGFSERVDASLRATTNLRVELAALRTELAERDRQIVRDAFEVVRDSGRQVGIAQQQAAALADSDGLFQLAGDLAASGAVDFLTDRERTPDVSRS